MRTGSLLWTALTALAVSSFLVTGCGDDSPTGGGSEGGGGSEAGGGGSDPTGGSPTGGSGGQGGQGGSGGAPANDTCEAPGDISIGPGEEVAVQGTLDGANDDYQTSCADNLDTESAIDVLYEVTVTADCNATLSLDGAGDFDGVISVRSACETEALTDQCFNASTSVTESGSVVFAAGVYYLMVSDVSNSGGAFALNIQCGAPTCGDNILDADEECDFAGVSAAPDDGCSDICTLEPNDPGETACNDVTAGAAIAVGLNETVFYSGSTINGASDNIGSCQEPPAAPNLPSKENIIKIRPSAVGTLTLTLGEDMDGNPYCPPNPAFPYPAGCYDRSIYVRTVCATPATEVGCVETDLVGNWYDVETLTIPVAVANVDYYVFVDGWLDYVPDGDQSDIGIYDLKIELTP